MKHKKDVSWRWRNLKGLVSVCVSRASKACQVRYSHSCWLWMVQLYDYSSFAVAKGSKSCCFDFGGPTREGMRKVQFNLRKGFFNFFSGELLYSISRKACNCLGTGLTYILSNRTVLSVSMRYWRNRSCISSDFQTNGKKIVLWII